LTQLYSLRYGTLPVASAVGGLKDTVRSYPDQGCTGFVFSPVQSRPLLASIKQAVHLWREEKDLWHTMQQRAMGQDFSWPQSARQYLDCYAELGLRGLNLASEELSN
ncbi:MAG: hypothetical protein ACOC43_08640, partial [Desulfohalobiaceae bacterium]